MTSGLTFDRLAHTYAFGGRILPSITRVIRAAGHSDGEWSTDEALKRGSAVHLATLAFDLGDDVPLLPESWLPYFEAYLAFRAAVPCRWKELEQPRASRRLWFAGTPDRVGTVNALPSLLELKTGGPAEWHGMQTAAQDLLLGGKQGSRRRLVVYLSAKGKFALRQHDDPADYLRFLEALRGYKEN